MVEVFYLSKKKKSRSKIYLSRECVNFMNLDLGRQTLHHCMIQVDCKFSFCSILMVLAVEPGMQFVIHCN